MNRHAAICLVGIAICTAAGVPSITAATVSFDGKLFSEHGDPVAGGEIIIGYFASSFDPYNYSCVYGDGFCNLESGAYADAVADGNFFPLRTGVFTDVDGSFSGAFINDATPGTKLWMFAFDDASRNSFFQVLASSTNSSWLMPSQPFGSTTLIAADANQFVMGFSHPEGIQLNVIPFPEPGTLVLWALSGALVCLKR